MGLLRGAMQKYVMPQRAQAPVKGAVEQYLAALPRVSVMLFSVAAMFFSTLSSVAHADISDAEVTIDVVDEQATPDVIYHEIRLPQPASSRARQNAGTGSDSGAQMNRNPGEAARERAQEAAAERRQRRELDGHPGNRPDMPPGQNKY